MLHSTFTFRSLPCKFTISSYKIIFFSRASAFLSTICHHKFRHFLQRDGDGNRNDWVGQVDVIAVFSLDQWGRLVERRYVAVFMLIYLYVFILFYTKLGPIASQGNGNNPFLKWQNNDSQLVNSFFSGSLIGIYPIVLCRSMDFRDYITEFIEKILSFLQHAIIFLFLYSNSVMLHLLL